MSLAEHLGRRAKLTIRRFGSPGAILALGENEDILLLGPEIPEGAKEGEEVDVFVHLDSEGRPLATTKSSKLELGDVAFLRVTAVTKIGAFVDWGLAKELLVPFKEQTADMNVGGRYPIGLYIDDTGRLAGTMRVTEMLDNTNATWTEDEWVEGEAWREDPAIGLFVIVERAFVGLVPRDEPHGLQRGESARFRITKHPARRQDRALAPRPGAAGAQQRRNAHPASHLGQRRAGDWRTSRAPTRSATSSA